MELFVRLQEGINNSGTVIPLTEYEDVTKLKSLLREGPGSDWYTSLFYFPEEFNELYLKNKSIAGYKGPAYSKSLVWDFDSKEDLNLAKNDVRELLTRLAKQVGNGKELLKHVTVYFSGNKGFHVFLKTNKEFSPEEMKHICSSIADKLPTFDKVIYNATRAFRIANTKHAASGLYKIKVDPIDLAKEDFIETVKSMAKNPGTWEDTSTELENVAFLESILDTKPLKKSIILEDVEEVDGIRGINLIDFRKSKDIPKCIYALTHGVMKPGVGHRHHIFLHLGNFYRNKGYPKDVAYNMLKGVSRLNKQLYPEFEEMTKEEIWNNVIKMVFADENALNPGGWGVSPDDEIFASYCKSLPWDCKCPIHSITNNKKAVVKIEDVALDFGSFATNFTDNIVTSGISVIDDNMKIATGTTTLLVGAAGSGKTTLCLNMLEHTNKENYASMFFSMDMHKNLLYLKLAQRHTRRKQDEIFRAFRDNDKKMIAYINSAIKENYGNTFFDFSGSLTLDDLRQRIFNTEQENQKKIKLVIVDYASRLRGPHSDSNANEKYNALASKDVAAETDAAWIILNQVSRATGDGSTPIRTKRAAKGSGDWEESASNVITVWRPFMGLDGVEDNENEVTYHDQVMRVFLAKNRMGPEVEGVLLWNGEGGLVRDMTPQELEQFENEERRKEKLARMYKNEHKS